MGKIVLMLLAVLMLGGCTEVEDIEETKNTIIIKNKSSESITIELFYSYTETNMTFAENELPYKDLEFTKLKQSVLLEQGKQEIFLSQNNEFIIKIMKGLNYYKAIISVNEPIIINFYDFNNIDIQGSYKSSYSSSAYNSN